MATEAEIYQGELIVEIAEAMQKAIGPIIIANADNPELEPVLASAIVTLVKHAEDNGAKLVKPIVHEMTK